MTPKHLGLIGLAIILLISYNGTQPDLSRMRTMYISADKNPEIEATTPEQKKLKRQLTKERYGPSLVWLDRLMAASKEGRSDDPYAAPRFDARVLSSLMVAGLASGFKSQVANLLWMKSDEYWHQGMFTRQNPIMEMVVTLDPEFVDAWSMAGWHWAYNIYADIPIQDAYKGKPKLIRQKQDKAIEYGLDYLKRGANINPDTYRLWFDWARTRSEKAGLLDEETIELFHIAHSKDDIRQVTKYGPRGEVIKEEGGLDVVGHSIGHIYEQIPEIDKALDAWGRRQIKATPQERAMLRAIGEYWRRYGSDAKGTGYAVIGKLYESGDAVIKARIKKLVPDVERLIAAHKVRERLQVSQDGRASTPTGAYVTISARYLPAWNLMKQDKLHEAINLIIGVMNVDPRYHLTGLPVLAKVLEIRGDAPAAIQKELKTLRDIEKSVAQDISLHFLARLYEEAAEREKDARKKKAYLRLAYETWYRARARDGLDFYALRKTRKYEDEYRFTAPQAIIKAIEKSREKGDINAAPAAPPNIQEYYDKS